MSSECSADALLLTLLSSAGFQYCKLSISSWSLLKHIQSKLKLETLSNTKVQIRKEKESKKD